MTQLPLTLSDGGDEYLTVAEAAMRLRCCERTIRRAIESGALRAGRLRGGRASRGAWRIRPADLEAWLFVDDAAETRLMRARDARQPVVDIRRRIRTDGTVEEIPTVRYHDAAGKAAD